MKQAAIKGVVPKNIEHFITTSVGTSFHGIVFPSLHVVISFLASGLRVRRSEGKYDTR
jgi:hypothetical protein